MAHLVRKKADGFHRRRLTVASSIAFSGDTHPFDSAIALMSRYRLVQYPVE